MVFIINQNAYCVVQPYRLICLFWKKVFCDSNRNLSAKGNRAKTGCPFYLTIPAKH